MALLNEIDPPSQSVSKGQSEKTNNLRAKFLNKNYSNLLSKLFLVQKNAKNDFLALNNFFVGLRRVLFDKKFAPHTIIVLLAFVVCATNISQKIAAKAFYENIVTTTPDVEYSVVKSADQYTSLIQSDHEIVQKSLTAQTTSSDGFAVLASSIATEVTAREEPSVLPNNESKTIYYTVLDGDTLSGLGMKFDVKVATLKYVNDLSNENMLKPGLKLKIPPKNYEIPQSLLAQKEKEQKAKLATANRSTITRDSSKSRRTVNAAPGSKSNAYPYGWCTYYVATKRFVPASWGNAKQWLGSARNAGYSTGSSPAAGAILVTSESGWGHVAYVESVNDGSITISEMNYEGWGVVSRRTISTGSGVIRGYIY